MPIIFEIIGAISFIALLIIGANRLMTGVKWRPDETRATKEKNDATGL